MGYTKLRTFPSRLEAEMAAEVLNKSQIPSIIQSEDTAIFGPGSVPSPRGARLLVPKEDMELARDLLRNIFGEDAE